MTTKWHTRYLDLAQSISDWSKDPSTRVGAVAIGKYGQVLSQGFNGFPRGIQDTPDLYDDRDAKYDRIVHAEMNVIYNACRTGVSLDGATLYVYGLPLCSECAKGIIQVGISTVVMPHQQIPYKWQKSCHLSERLLDEAGVKRIYVRK